ncbi:MAG: hypothetical protein RL417_865 [Pseudomonadota bacterium]|jgi:hypothetical protein
MALLTPFIFLSFIALFILCVYLLWVVDRFPEHKDSDD